MSLSSNFSTAEPFNIDGNEEYDVEKTIVYKEIEQDVLDNSVTHKNLFDENDLIKTDP